MLLTMAEKRTETSFALDDSMMKVVCWQLCHIALTVN